MSQSLAKVLVHIIFSTKGRTPVIAPEVRHELNAYIVAFSDNSSARPS